MNPIRDDLFYFDMLNAQVTNTFKEIQFFLFSIGFVCSYIFVIFYIIHQTNLPLFSLWLGASLLFIILCSALSYLYFRQQMDHIQILDRWLKFISLGVGGILCSGFIIINRHVSVISGADASTDVLILSTSLILIALVMSLALLTARLHYFFLVFVPSILPILIPQFLQGSYSLYYLSYDFAFIAILLSTSGLHHSKNKMALLVIKNKQLTEKTERIKQQLENNNQQLEEKVKERTQDIEQINANLERSQQNLALAHETAHITSWDWDIQHRHIETLNFHQEHPIRNQRHSTNQVMQLIHPDDQHIFYQAMKQHLRGHTDRYDATYRFKINNQWVWMHDLGRVIQRDPKTKIPLRMVGIRQNIHQEKLAAEQLQLSASVFQQAAEGIFILDENLNYLDVNPYFEKISGLSKQKIVKTKFLNLSIENPEHPFKEMILNHLKCKGLFDGEIQLKFAATEQIQSLWLRVHAIENEQQQIRHYIGIVSDLTERINHEKQLSYLQNYDALTDLPNRHFYQTKLHQLIAADISGQHKFAVIRVNLDRFRYLNEMLHNQGGDELLRQVAERLRYVNAEGLLTARLSGDNFAIIYDLSQPSADLQSHCEQIMRVFSQPFHIHAHDFIVTATLGIALYPEHGRQMDSLHSHTEQALKAAKKLGGNTIHVFVSEDEELKAEFATLERELRQAIKNNELEVFYQPKVECHTHKTVGFEALIRWYHPSKGLITPLHFIPFAEQTSLISDIGLLVIQQTTQQIRKWYDMGFTNIRVSINVVPQQLKRGQLIAEIDQALIDADLPGACLEMEITESSFMDNTQKIQQVLQQIRERNIRISLDDFGTGFSSLAYLTQYPIDILKIDREFILKIGHEKQEAIVSAMIAMGKTMGMQVVAEGIETQEQLDFLTLHQCDLLQGYLFAKPMNAQLSTEYLLQHQ